MASPEARCTAEPRGSGRETPRSRRRRHHRGRQDGQSDGTGDVQTRMMLDEVDPKTSVRKATPTKGSAETFVYDDARRLATYTAKARIMVHRVTSPPRSSSCSSSPAPTSSSAPKAMATTSPSKDALRTATGDRLTYTAADDQYVMTGAVGNPVVVVEKKPGSCAKTLGSRLTFSEGR